MMSGGMAMLAWTWSVSEGRAAGHQIAAPGDMHSCIVILDGEVQDPIAEGRKQDRFRSSARARAVDHNGRPAGRVRVAMQEIRLS